MEEGGLAPEKGWGASPLCFLGLKCFSKLVVTYYFSVPLIYLYIESYTQHSSNVSHTFIVLSVFFLYFDVYRYHFSCYSELNVFFFISFLRSYSFCQDF